VPADRELEHPETKIPPETPIFPDRSISVQGLNCVNIVNIDIHGRWGGNAEQHAPSFAPEQLGIATTHSSK
jgi:hypothetical protein